MTNRLSVPIRHLARIATIVFALFVLGWLVVNAERNANRIVSKSPPATAPTAAPPAPAPEFLYSSKSLVIEPSVLGGPVLIAPPEPFLPSSKFGRPSIAPPLPPASEPGPGSAPQGPRERRS